MVETYSQHGEDVVFATIFDRLGVSKPSYLDLGAFHPTDVSNTALLYARGSRGINVEPIPALFAAFLEARPDDLSLNCAVGAKRQDFRRFYVTKNPWASSFHRSLIADRIVEEIDVPVRTVGDILSAHNGGRWPDLLDVDIEGEDAAVLRECLPPEGERPVVVCVEAVAQRKDSTAELTELMTSRRYFLFCRRGANMIWVRVEERERLP